MALNLSQIQKHVAMSAWCGLFMQKVLDTQWQRFKSPATSKPRMVDTNIQGYSIGSPKASWVLFFIFFSWYTRLSAEERICLSWQLRSSQRLERRWATLVSTLLSPTAMMTALEAAPIVSFDWKMRMDQGCQHKNFVNYHTFAKPCLNSSKSTKQSEI